jgi:hypothetical protein
LLKCLGMKKEFQVKYIGLTVGDMESVHIFVYKEMVGELFLYQKMCIKLYKHLAVCTSDKC